MRIFICVVALILAGCGGGSTSLPTPSPSFTQGSSTADIPLPDVTVPPSNGKVATFTTCIPVFDELAYVGPGQLLQVGCASSAKAPSPSGGSWIINGNTTPSLKCFVRVDQASGDIIEFLCAGNPYA